MPCEIPVTFPSAAHESRFRRILGEMSVARVEETETGVISYFRPKNLFAFEQKLHGAGLKHCETSNHLVKYLVRHPDEFVQIVVSG